MPHIQSQQKDLRLEISDSRLQSIEIRKIWKHSQRKKPNVPDTPHKVQPRTYSINARNIRQVQSMNSPDTFHLMMEQSTNLLGGFYADLAEI